MSPFAWISKNSGTSVAIIVLLASLVVARSIPPTGATVLGDESVIQLLGVILAGQLAVLALTVPAVLELRGDVLESSLADDLSDDLDGLLGELKSNTFWTFAFLAVVFALSVITEAHADLLETSLPFGFTAGNAFVAVKLAAIVLSGLAMWDSIEPLFGIGLAMTTLKQIRQSSHGGRTAGSGGELPSAEQRGRHLKV